MNQPLLEYKQTELERTEFIKCNNSASYAFSIWYTEDTAGTANLVVLSQRINQFGPMMNGAVEPLLIETVPLKSKDESENQNYYVTIDRIVHSVEMAIKARHSEIGEKYNV